MKYIKALIFYFANTKINIVSFSKESKIWKVETITQVKGEYICFSNYRHKYKFIAKILWVFYFASTVNDLYREVF